MTRSEAGRGRVAFAAAVAAVILLANGGPTIAANLAPSLVPSEREAIDRIGTEALAAQSVAGLSVTIARAGDIVYARGFGAREKGGPDRVDAATIFPIGSITKQFTSAAIALLVRDGRISFDAKLATYLPDAPHASEITIRQLLDQTSGLANYTSQPAFLGTIATSATIAPSALLASVAHEPLGFTPGSHFEYSNTNYIALGAVIEAVTKRSYASFIHDRIARPLGLATLSFGPPVDRRDVVRSPWTPQATFSAGALYASPADLARFDRAFFSGELVPQEMVRVMTTPPSLPSASMHYAFAWVADSLDGREQLWHNGGVLGASTRNCVFPKEDVAVIVFGNAIDFDPGPVVRAAMRVVAPPSAAAIAAERAPAAGEDAAITAKARTEFAAWASGAIDRTRYAASMREAVDDTLLATVARGLAAAGAPSAFVYKGSEKHDAIVIYRYRVETPQTPIAMSIAFDGDGAIAGIHFVPAP